jgi:AcrR family transcriptional regulator
VVGTPKRDRTLERREATRAEILAAAWEAAHEASLATFTLREVAERVGMQPPSLYFHFPSKNAIYDAMFEQAWQGFLTHVRQRLDQLPSEPRARLSAAAQEYFDYAVADLARHQLMDERTVPTFEPSPQAYAPSVEVYALLLEHLPLPTQDDADIYSALIAGLVSQQLANDPEGQRWRRLLPRVISMFADNLGLPPDPPCHAAGTLPNDPPPDAAERSAES